MLTDTIIQSILPAARPIKKADGGGLNICVLPNGRREWRLSYRFDYKQKSITGGDYPLMSIDRARVWREEMKAVLSAGNDPADIKRQRKYEDQAERTTFRQLAQEWMLAKRPGWSERYAGVIERRLEADIFPTIGKLPVRSILPRDMLNALKTIEDRSAFEMAHRVRAYCSEIFRFGIPDGRVLTDPCRDLGTVTPFKHPVDRQGPHIGDKLSLLGRQRSACPDLLGDRGHALTGECQRALGPVLSAIGGGGRHIERAAHHPTAQEIVRGLGILARAGGDGREERDLVDRIPAHIDVAHPITERCGAAG